jgi:hypothetical protein
MAALQRASAGAGRGQAGYGEQREGLADPGRAVLDRRGGLPGQRPGRLGLALPGRVRGTLDSVRIAVTPPDEGSPGHGAWAGGLLDSRREVPAVPDNIVLIMRFHPVGGEDVTVVSEDFGSEREALEAIARRWTNGAAWS